MWWERHPRLVDAFVLLFWAALVGGSLLLALSFLDREAERVAYERARVLFRVIETTRLWNARHGGLYARVTADTPPNPWLADPQRDVTIDGESYTKINPAYMTRQISEMLRGQEGVAFAITSLRPLNPANAPDAWEEGALRSFDGERGEILALTDGPAGPRFRYMAALRVSEECLHCHAMQGYAIGDVRGGLSVSIPAQAVFDDFSGQRAQLVALHGVVFVLLAGGGLVFLARVRRNWSDLAAAKAEQEGMVAARTAELRIANQALQHSNAELEAFAYAISHDLQEPLRMIGGYGGLLKRRHADRLDAEGLEFMGYMVDGAERMRGMIDGLLAYSRADRQALDPHPVDLGPVCAAALVNLGAALDETAGEVAAAVDGHVVLGEASQILRLFQNLLGNALKYRHPDRRPRITVSARACAGGMVEVTVADNGLGIPPESRERVFAIFHRLRQNDAAGSGMGLALARRIVERHGGHIRADDPAAGSPGAVFRFTLPAA